MSDNKEEVVPFSDLPPFDKPEAASYSLTCKPLGLEKSEEAKAIIGYEPGINEIYYQDKAIAGNYHIPKPLEKMTSEEFTDWLGDNDNKIVSKTNFTRLWKQTQGEPTENQ